MTREELIVLPMKARVEGFDPRFFQHAKHTLEALPHAKSGLDASYVSWCMLHTYEKLNDGDGAVLFV